MKQKRAKQYRKSMKLLHLNFKFREPYQVLVDEEIVLEAVRCKYDLVKGLNSVLQGEIKPMITQCAMEALYKTKNQEAIDLAKRFERRRCGHLPGDDNSQKDNEEAHDRKSKAASGGTQSAFDCILSVVSIKNKNKHRYVVATQKIGLRKVFKTIPAVPLIFLHRNVIIMEPLSDITQRTIALNEQQKLTGGLNDPNAALRDEDGEGEGEGEERPKKKRKGPKEPNPLSMKKKRVQSQAESVNNDAESGVGGDGGSRKRRRKHNRGANKEHVDSTQE